MPAGDEPARCAAMPAHGRYDMIPPPVCGVVDGPKTTALWGGGPLQPPPAGPASSAFRLPHPPACPPCLPHPPLTHPPPRPCPLGPPPPPARSHAPSSLSHALPSEMDALTNSLWAPGMADAWSSQALEPARAAGALVGLGAADVAETGGAAAGGGGRGTGAGGRAQGPSTHRSTPPRQPSPDPAPPCQTLKSPSTWTCPAWRRAMLPSRCPLTV